jgi:acyl carrier protein
MDADKAVSAVNDILATEFEIERAEIIPSATLNGQLGLDSLDAVDFVVALEKALAIKIPEDAARKLKTVGDVHAYVREAIRS